MSSLTAEQLDELAEILASEIRRLERSMDLSEEHARTVVLDQTAVGRLSRMDSLQNQAMAQGLHDREAARYAALMRAVERLEEGSYGTCSECGGEIAYGRLLVIPEADVCGDCAG